MKIFFSGVRTRDGALTTTRGRLGENPGRMPSRMKILLRGANPGRSPHDHHGSAAASVGSSKPVAPVIGGRQGRQAAIDKGGAAALAVAITAATQPARPAVSRCTCQLPPRPRRRRFSQQVGYPTRRRRPPHPLPSQRWLAGSAAVMPAPRHRRVFATLVAVNGATAAPARDDGGTGGSSGGGSGGDGGGDSPDAQSCGGSARVGWSGHCCIGAITCYRA